MTTHGRGAWPVSGTGGTFDYKANTPGPYYYLGSGTANTTPDEQAVHGAVYSYQRALNVYWGANLKQDGVYGQKTFDAVFKFQSDNNVPNTTPWGGIGPDTSKALLWPVLVKAFNTITHPSSVTQKIVCGVITQESLWDNGAVGYVDTDDLGLGQENARSHPDLSNEDRQNPLQVITRIIQVLSQRVAQFGNIDDAIASYNLGAGGVSQWIAAGRPDEWTPNGETEPRDVRGYINKIKTACN